MAANSSRLPHLVAAGCGSAELSSDNLSEGNAHSARDGQLPTVYPCCMPILTLSLTAAEQLEQDEKREEADRLVRAIANAMASGGAPLDEEALAEIATVLRNDPALADCSSADASPDTDRSATIPPPGSCEAR